MDLQGCENRLEFCICDFLILFLHKFIVECILKAKEIVFTILEFNNHTSSVTVAKHLMTIRPLSSLEVRFVSETIVL